MNKIYKVIYCKATQTWVAVSEITKSHGKGGVRGTVHRVDNTFPFGGRIKALTLAVLMGLGFAQQASAEVCDLYDNLATDNDGGAVSTGALSLACGSGATTGTKKGSTAIGQSANASTKHSATAVGANTVASGANSIAIGGHKNATNAAQATANNTVAIGTKASSSATQATAVGTAAKATGIQSTAIGDRSEAHEQQAVALGSLALAKGSQSMAIGNNTLAINLGSISFGGDDSDYQGATPVSPTGTWQLKQAYPSYFNDAAGSKVYYGDVGAGIGENTTATIPGPDGEYNARWRKTLSGGLGATAIGTHAQTLSDGSVAIGIGATAGLYNGGATDPSTLTAADFNINQRAKRATAIGAVATAQGEQSTAIGVLAKATGEDSSAIGSNAKTVGENSSAFGYNATAWTEGSVAIGENAVAGHATVTTKKDAIAIGTGSQATGNNSIAVGTGNKVSGNHSGAFGDPSIINGSDSYSVGNDNAIGSTSSDIFILGNETRIGGTLNTATGVVTDTTAHTEVIALGNNITTVVDHSVFLGNDSAYVADDNARTQGIDNTYTSDNTVLDNTTLSFAGGDEVVGIISVGNASETRRIQNVAPGEISATSTDAINGSQLYSIAEELQAADIHYFSVNATSAVRSYNNAADTSNKTNDGALGIGALAIGIEAAAKSNYSTAVGNTAVANGDYAVALGRKATTNKREAIAIGHQAHAIGAASTAIGLESKTKGSSDIAIGNQAVTTAGNDNVAIGRKTHATGGKSTAIGYKAEATLANAVAIGSESDATGSGSVAIGHSSEASAKYAFAAARDSEATADYAIAIGYNSQANTASAVALGHGSIANRRASTAATLAGFGGYNPATGTYSDGGGAIDATRSNLAVVSVGNVTHNADGTVDTTATNKLRQITGVAAGTNDADAVNVAQLKAVANVAAAADRNTFFHTNNTGSAVAYNPAETNEGLVDATAGAFGINSLAAGVNAHAQGQNSVSVGYQNKITQTAPTLSDDTTAVGQRNTATDAKNGVLLGADNTIISSTSVAAIGGSNAATTSHASSLTGIGNTLSNSSAVNVVGIANQVTQTSGLTPTQLAAFATLQTNLQNPTYVLTAADRALINTLSSNYVAGTLNKLSNSKRNTVMGNFNTLTNGTENFVAGFNNTLGANLTGNQIIGSNVTVSANIENGVAIGSNTQLSENGGVALGYGSIANRAALTTGVTTNVNATAKANQVYANTSATTAQKNAITDTVVGNLGAVSVGSGTATRQITHVAAGSENSDAVNVAQLKAVAAVAQTASAGWNIGGNDGKVGTSATKNIGAVAPTKQVTFVSGDSNNNTKVAVTQVGGQSTVTITAAKSPMQYTNTNNADGKNTANNDQFTATNQVTLVGAGAGQVTVNNVANATLSADSKQAVNGSQLYGTGNSIASIIGGDLTTIDSSTGVVTFGDKAGKGIGDTGATNIHDAFKTISAVASAHSVVTKGTNIASVTKNTVGGQTTYTVNAKGTTVSGTGAVSVVGTPNTVTNVTDYAVSVATDDFTTSATGKVSADTPAALATSKDIADAINNSGFTLTTTASAGSVSGSSNELVNPGETVTIDAGRNIAITQTNGNISVATQKNVTFDQVDVGPVTISKTTGIDAGNTTITNVAPGVNGTDAVNVNQLNAATGGIVNNINNLYAALDDARDDANAGTAAALAAANLPQPHDPGANMVSAAVGTYEGQSAVSIGVSAISDNGKWIIKGSLTHDTQNNTGAGVGIGYQW